MIDLPLTSNFKGADDSGARRSNFEGARDSDAWSFFKLKLQGISRNHFFGNWSVTEIGTLKLPALVLKRKKKGGINATGMFQPSCACYKFVSCSFDTKARVCSPSFFEVLT
jgi:hypothetical protein